MGIATGTLIAAGIAAGASAGSSYMQSRAAGKAADQQRASADAATRLQRDIFEQQRADAQPWMRAGQGAVSTLANLSGIPMGGPGTGGIPGQASQLPPSQARQPSPQAQPTGRVAVPRSLAQLGQGGQGMVGLRAPDGSTRYVPQDQAGFYEQRGATRF